MTYGAKCLRESANGKGRDTWNCARELSDKLSPIRASDTTRKWGTQLEVIISQQVRGLACDVFMALRLQVARIGTRLMLPTSMKARVYIAITLLAGLLSLSLGLFHAQWTEPSRYVCYLAL